jgi:hypothetical protein
MKLSLCGCVTYVPGVLQKETNVCSAARAVTVHSQLRAICSAARTVHSQLPLPQHCAPNCGFNCCDETLAAGKAPSAPPDHKAERANVHLCNDTATTSLQHRCIAVVGAAVPTASAASRSSTLLPRRADAALLPPCSGFNSRA